MPSTPETNSESESKEVFGMAVDKLDVVAKARKGLTAAEIAKLHDVTPEFIEKIIEEARQKGAVGSGMLSHEDRAKRRREIADFVAGGKTTKEAAKKFGVTTQSVIVACREFGVEAKGVAERNIPASGYKVLAALIGSPDMDGVRIAEKLGVTRQYVNLVKKRATESGLITAIENAKKAAVEEDRKKRK